MISCVVIDDEPKAIDVLKRYIEKVSFLDLKESFRDPLLAIEFLQKESIGLIFLDINMPHLSGIDLFQVLPYKPLLIFTTAYSEYALESYELGAVDYLLKPISFDRFLKAITRANEQFQLKSSALETAVPTADKIAEKEYIYLKSGSKIHKINVVEILYVAKDGNYLVFHTAKNKVLARQNMNQVFKIVSPEKFVRIHKSYLVAYRHIKVIQSHQVVLANDLKLPVGVAFRDGLMKRLKD